MIYQKKIKVTAMQKINPASYQPSKQQHNITQSSHDSFNNKLTSKHLMAMTKLWQLLTDELGSAFRNQYGDAGGTAFNHWSKELAAFSESQLVAGLNKFKKAGSTYMSLNIFRNLCTPKAEDFGLPSFDEAFSAVIFAKWADVPEAMQVLFSQHRYDLKQLSDTEARKRFKPIYEDAIKRILAGEEIKKQERARLENPSGTTHTKTHNGPTGNEALSNLLGMMGKKCISRQGEA